MVDDADMTQDRIEKEDASQAKAARANVIAYETGYRELIPCGRCYYCDSEVDGQRVYCNGTCSGYYEAEKKQMEASGK